MPAGLALQSARCVRAGPVVVAYKSGLVLGLCRIAGKKDSQELARNGHLGQFTTAGKRLDLGLRASPGRRHSRELAQNRRPGQLATAESRWVLGLGITGRGRSQELARNGTRGSSRLQKASGLGSWDRRPDTISGSLRGIAARGSSRRRKPGLGVGQRQTGGTLMSWRGIGAWVGSRRRGRAGRALGLTHRRQEALSGAGAEWAAGSDHDGGIRRTSEPTGR